MDSVSSVLGQQEAAAVCIQPTRMRTSEADQLRHGPKRAELRRNQSSANKTVAASNLDRSRASVNHVLYPSHISTHHISESRVRQRREIKNEGVQHQT